MKKPDALATLSALAQENRLDVFRLLVEAGPEAAAPVLAGLAVRLPSRAGAVVVVADRSQSMPANAEAAQQEALALLQRAMGGSDQLAVVSFGQRAAVERAPQAGPFAGFTQAVGGEASNLSEAACPTLILAMSLGATRASTMSR